ncbi:MAG: zinc ABC transporter substrate-binding protein [Actinobacteria bacterium]|nr:zinc ABC transporter substrate-binding protein [Actinomycetota bacterium]
MVFKVVVAGVVAAVAVTACSSSAGGGSGSVSLVASTNVWGDVAQQVAGKLAGHKVAITSIISDPAADPHSYEADTRNQLEISRAAVIVENGGGYDDFVDTMRQSAGSKATVLNAVAISGKQPVDGDLNEHVWYDFPTVAKVTDQIADALAKADPADAATFHANAAAFDRQLAGLEAAEAEVKATYAGTGVAITEPVPLYLLQACGLVDRTPEEFSHAVEEGNDVAPRVLQQTLALFSGHQVKLLAYNEQTSGAETQQVQNAAKANHIPVVGVTETLPAGQTFLTWMSGNLAAIKAALHG